MKFERAQTRLLEPFAVSGILFGLALIGVRILAAGSTVSKATLLGLLKGSVIVSAATGLIYGAFVLRAKLKGRVADRILYIVTIAIFVSIIVGASLLM
jgi:hypothetical protein